MNDDLYASAERERNLVSARFFLISVVHGRNLILLLFNTIHELSHYSMELERETF